MYVSDIDISAIIVCIHSYPPLFTVPPAVLDIYLHLLYSPPLLFTDALAIDIPAIIVWHTLFFLPPFPLSTIPLLS